MKKYNNFRIVYLNLNILYILLSLFLLYKCVFTKLIVNDDHEHHKRLYALGIITTISCFITGYVGCSAVWFQSKAWTQIQILLSLLLLPFVILAYLMERIRRGDHQFHDQLCEYVMLALFAFGIAIVFTAYKFIEVLRREADAEKQSEKSTAPFHLMTSTPTSSTHFLAGSLASLNEKGHWNLAGFGKFNPFHSGSVHSLVSTPSINLLLDATQLPPMSVKFNKVQDKALPDKAITDSK